MSLRQPDARFDSIRSSLDLTAAAARLRNQLLEVAMTLPSLLKDGPQLAAALHRYEAYWLPLVASGSKPPTTIAPPVDVQWVWQCHMLSPTTYTSDMQHVFGRVLDHALLGRGERLHAQQRARVAWEEQYPGVPFELQPDGSDATRGVAAKFVSQFKYDIEAAALRQAAFIYQVALPHYADTQVFLRMAVQRYRWFCYLHAMNPGVRLAPTYDIDMVWHAHMMHPILYASETAEWSGGKVFKHDDTLNDRTPGSQLSKAAIAVRKLWAEWFTDAYEANGGMLRGDPATALGNVNVGARTQYTQDLAAAVSAITVIVEKPALQWTGLKCRLAIPSAVRYTLNPRSYYNALTPAVSDWVRSMRGAASSVSAGGSGAKPSDNAASSLQGTSCGLLLTVVNGAFAPCNLQDIFAVEQNSAQTVSMLCGQLALAKPVSGHAAIHTVCDSYGKELFIVQVSYDASMTRCCPVPPLHAPRACVIVRNAKSHEVEATAHMSGPYELPTPQQVDETRLLMTVTLDEINGERAMIIRGRDGDWGVCKGTWVGKQKGVPGEKAPKCGVPGKIGIPGDPGSFQLQAFRLHKAGSEAEALCEPQRVASAIDIRGHISLDLTMGYLNIANCHAVPELVAFAFAVGVLRLISSRVAVLKELTEQEIVFLTSAGAGYDYYFPYAGATAMPAETAAAAVVAAVVAVVVEVDVEVMEADVEVVEAAVDEAVI
eukprot:jgi/Chlat1/7491/Chrsp61S07003